MPMKIAPAGSESHISSRRIWIIAITILLALDCTVFLTRPVFSQEIVLTDHSICQDINPETGLPLNRTSKFLSSDRQAISWIEAEVKEMGPSHFAWYWFDPQNRVYKNTTHIENFISTGPRRLWDVLPIRGQTENLTGNWTVRVYFRARLLVSENFAIDPIFYEVKITAKGLAPTCKVNVYLDNRRYGEMIGASTHTVTVPIGAPHNISLDSVSQASDLARFVCTSNCRIVASKSDLVFEYEAQYYLRVQSEYGAVEPNAEGWYRNGTRVMFRIESPVVGSFGVRYFFVSWSGDFSGNSLFVMVVMDRPRTIVAIWKTDHSAFYFSIGLVITVVCGLIFFTKRKARARRMSDRYSSGFVGGC